jgi:magnesium transporter
MIKSFQLDGGALHAVERLDAEVMLFSNPDAAERDLLHSHFKLDEHALASALTRCRALSSTPTTCS